ncbi:hypothetical protein O6H91_08G079200 [Diphasiastrum complanatum]|nr:hypothetical protein O6H91_08G079200 [Diphasiastrum complanatum]
MSSAAVSYGSNGQAFCGLRADGSNVVSCFGTDAASVYGAPPRVEFMGLTAGDGFICGLTFSSHQPYCWGNNIFVQQGVPSLPGTNSSYRSISAGDNHLCALRDPTSDGSNGSSVDCWGFNMTGSFINAPLVSISSGSLFTCGLYPSNSTPICWGDETGSEVISTTPQKAFISISAGGYHVCGVLRDSTEEIYCWGRALDSRLISLKGVVSSSLVGGKFHECGLQVDNHTPVCWGLSLPTATSVPKNLSFIYLVAGDYFTCGIAALSFLPLCWGSGYPASLPITVAPGLCSPQPCKAGSYRYSNNLGNGTSSLCQNISQDICVSCSQGCPLDMYMSAPCSLTGDRECTSCSQCNDSDCSQICSIKRKHVSIQAPIIIGELSIAVVVIAVILLVAFVWFRSASRRDMCAGKEKSASTLVHAVIKKSSFRSSFRKGKAEVWAHEELKIVPAYAFKYDELEQATGGFVKESEIGKGSFSCVYKGILSDGRVVAVKRATLNVAKQCNAKDSKDFHNELDLLSRLNHAHLLNLLGYCEENGERLLVYEFMVNGTLHEHLHGKYGGRLSWIRRVTIAVQAARGLEYLHGYACPPVIHRDIKSANILLDDEWNARVADFGLSLLGPPDSNSPLSELPAGTLGYLDPEYYRLHYLTTKSDVYSFGVLLLEILSGRKAIDMQYDEGNIVEWAVPLIKEGKILSILDVRLEAPANVDTLHKIAKIAARCVRMRGKERPSMGKVTTALERDLALLMGTSSENQLILPSEVVLGSNRLHRKGSRKSSVRRSGSEVGCHSCVISSDGEVPLDNPVLASLTFPSVASSQRRAISRSSIAGSESQDIIAKIDDEHYCIEIGPASPI